MAPKADNSALHVRNQIEDIEMDRPTSMGANSLEVLADEDHGVEVESVLPESDVSGEINNDMIEDLHPPESIAELVERMRELPGDGSDLSEVDARLKRRIKNFRDAQNLRSRMYHFRPFGIVGLFTNLSDIRSDLKWAEDVAKRERSGKRKLSWKQFEKKRTMGFNRPFFTYFIVLVNIVMMFVAFAFNEWKIEPFNVNPLIGPDPGTLLKLGALQTRVMIETGSWYRLITAVFLHGGILHLVINVGVIAMISRVIERNHGTFQTAVLFLVPAVGGNILSGVMQPGYILVGSSGGIFGLIGICVADIVLNWKLMFLVFKQYRGRSGFWIRFCCIFWLIFDLFINSIIGFTPFVDNFAHMGGLVYGFLLALTILDRLPLSFFGNKSDFCHSVKIYSLRFLGVAISCFLITVTTLLLSRSDGLRSPCLGCRYISCAPFPFWSEDKWWYCDGCDAVSGNVYHRRGNAYFSDLELFCPDGDIAYVDIFDDRVQEQDVLQLALPMYCRNYC